MTTPQRSPGAPPIRLSKGHQPGPHELGERDVRPVVDGQVSAQFPGTSRQQLVGPRLDVQGKQVRMSLGGLVGADQAGQLAAPDDVGSLEGDQPWGSEVCRAH